MHIPGSTKSLEYALDYKDDEIQKLKDIIAEIKSKNPQPDQFKYVRHCKAGNYIAIELIYTGCTNFDGRKILVLKCSENEFLFKMPKIDPHFSNKPETGTFHPIARFEPTEQGWLDAEYYIHEKNRQDGPFAK